MSDNDSECEIEHVSSIEEVLYEKVPKDTKYLLKFKNKENKTYKVLDYTLKKGKSLPYAKDFKGMFSSE